MLWPPSTCRPFSGSLGKRPSSCSELGRLGPPARPVDASPGRTSGASGAEEEGAVQIYSGVHRTVQHPVVATVAPDQVTLGCPLVVAVALTAELLLLPVLQPSWLFCVLPKSLQQSPCCSQQPESFPLLGESCSGFMTVTIPSSHEGDGNSFPLCLRSSKQPLKHPKHRLCSLTVDLPAGLSRITSFF